MKLLRGLSKYFSLINFLEISLIFFCLFAFKTQLIAKEFSISPNNTPELIDAINESNGNSETNTINLATSSAYVLTEAINNPSFDSTYGPNGLPLINSELVINGNNSTILRDTSSSRFRIFAIQFPGKLTINNSTISGGFSTNPTFGGGAIINLNGSLITNDSIISDNIALVGGGAGIWDKDGYSTLFRTTITNNNAGNNNETISSGGAFVKRGNGIFEVTESTINNNLSETIGGAIYSRSTGEIIIRNSTLLNNTTRLQGGGIYNYEGQVNITNSCISGNLPNAVINETVSSFIISAINNWWGHESGPSGAGGGSGDYISNRVDYIPFNPACTLSPPPSPSPTPTPTPTPSPSPTPEPTKTPVVILPGLGASWNTAAMISGGNSGSWKKTPFVKAYDNLKETLLGSAGYIEGDNYFEFYYDWRQPLDNLADTFQDFLTNTVLNGKPTNTKINLVGHSMGGMVSRTYAQKYGLDKINQLVTTGSPHEGAIKAWQGWSGAEIGEPWSWEWIGLQLYLQIHKGKYSSPVEAVRDLAPGLNNLSPIFNFAKDNNNQEINVSSMDEFNSYLDDLKNNLATDLKNLLTTIGGLEQNNDNDTVEWIKLGDRSLTDILLGKWTDGKPVSYEYTADGDLTILKKSALIEGTTQTTINASHLELVETSAGIQAILDALGITAIPATNTSELPRNPSLLFFLHSPANIQVTAPDGSMAGEGVDTPMSNSVYSPEDKLLLIFSALPGNYIVKIIGTGTGSYHLEIGQLTQSGEKWSSTANSITSGQTDSYQLIFNPDQPQDNPLSSETAETYLKLAKFNLEQLKEIISERNKTVYIDQVIRLIDRALAYLLENNLTQAERYIKVAIESNYLLRQKVNQSNYIINDAGEWLIKAFLKVDSQGTPKQAIKTLAGQRLNGAVNLYNLAVIKIKATINGENLEIGEALSLDEKFLNLAQISYSNKRYSETYIYSLVSQILSEEINQKI